MTKSEKPALILIDIQKGMDDLDYWGGRRNNPEAEENARQLLDYWRAEQLPVYHVKHNSTNPQSRLRPGQPGNEIKDIVKPQREEPLLQKHVNSAFIGTDLQQRLEAARIKTLVIIGLTTEHCVSTSVRMAANLGFTVYLPSDATATFDKVGPQGKKFSAETVHEVELASLHQEFATVLTTREVLELVAH